MAALITQPRTGDYPDVPTGQVNAGGAIPCPDPACLAPARIMDRFVLESTDGPVEHVNTHCRNGHGFTPRVASLV
jgi:hypothetical protein